MGDSRKGRRRCQLGAEMVERRREKSRLSGHFYPQLAFSESGIDHFCPQLAFTRENRKTVFAKTATEGFSACCSGAFLAEGDGGQGEEKGEKSPERGQIEPYGGKIGAAQHDGSQGVHAIGHGHEAA